MNHPIASLFCQNKRKTGIVLSWAMEYYKPQYSYHILIKIISEGYMNH